jgi:hypothetical protein
MSPLKVLVAGHDWGGLNVLAPLLRAWTNNSELEVEFLAAPEVRRDFAHRVPGLALAPMSGALSEWLCHRQGELDAFLGQVLERGAYQAIVCGTSAHALLERRMFMAARARGIPSVALCDMWWAYAERFHDGEAWTLPDVLWVLDETMHHAASAVKWPHPLKIEVVGSPLFGELACRRARHETGDARAVRFISEPASTKFPEARIDEFELAEMLLESLRDIDDATPLVIRPHPTDAIETWRRWVHTRRDAGAEMETLPADEAMKDTRVAVGISSIFLAEMRMCGIPTASLQPPDAELSYFCLPFEELGIARLTDREALTRWLGAPREGAPAAAAVHLGAIEAATASLMKLSGRA